jgi:TPR repeat protein
MVGTAPEAQCQRGSPDDCGSLGFWLDGQQDDGHKYPDCRHGRWQLCQGGFGNGTLQPLQLSLQKLDAGKTEKEVEAPKVSADGQPLPQSKPDSVEAAAPKAPVSAPPRDESLSDSLKELQDKAYAGTAEAQHDLAALYTAGSGVKQDYKRAAYWFDQAAGAGVANAAYNLGVLHHQGLGVEKNIQKALDWYRLAALKGHPEAQYNLGIAYIEGIGTKYTRNWRQASSRRRRSRASPKPLTILASSSKTAFSRNQSRSRP